MATRNSKRVLESTVCLGLYPTISKPTIDKLSIVPLVATGEQVFGDTALKITMQPWSYIGVRFVDAKTIEPVSVEIDQSKVTHKEAGDRAARYLQSDAVPAGRYVVLDESKKRAVVTLVDFGKAPEKKGE